jgi:RHS repeat-associated protein
LSVFGKRSRAATKLWRKPLLAWSRRLAIVMPLAVTAPMAAVPAPQAAAAVQLAPSVKCPASLPDEAAALITSRMCGGKVRIDDATSETTEAFALPSGQVERQVSIAPVRVKQAGKWTPVDLTLMPNADGTVSPRAQTGNLVLSGAQTDDGQHPLATVGTGSHRVAASWTGELPKPVLNGDRATYPEALPGVDLVVQATRTGAETFFVVKSRAAAAKVATLSMPVTGASVASHRRDADGNVTLLNKDDKPVATVPAPEMWDATTAPDGEPAKVRKVAAKAAKKAARKTKPKAAHDGAGVQLTLTPDQAFLNDPATRYPVTIDPQLNPLDSYSDTYIRDGDTVDRGGADDLQVGLANGVRARSLLRWPMDVLRGKQITSATAYFWNWWSPSCTAKSWEIWSTGPSTSDTRWANQPTWNTREATATATKGYSSTCNDGWVAISGTSFFQRAATAGQTYGYMGIRATDETDAASFKQFRSRNAADNSQVPYAVVNYNSYPVIGTRSTTPSSACATGTGRPYLNSTTPALKATVSDGEASPVKATFEWYTAGGAKIGGVTTATAASGSTLSAAPPAGAMVNGGSYSWRVQGNDGTVNGAWSSQCEFTVDTTGPTAAPTVASSTYPAGGSGGAPGVAGTFSFGANGVTDAAAFLYGLDTNPPTTVVNASTLGGSATKSITPSTAGTHTLYVRSRDRAGNLSPVTSHTFTVASTVGSITSPEAGELSAGTVVLSGSGSTTSTGVSYQWRRSETDAWTTIPAAQITQSSGAPVTWPVASTGSGSFPALNWNVEATVNAAEAGPDALDGPLQVRASFTGGTAGTSPVVPFELDRDRAGAPSKEIGPGSVNLSTGNFTVTASDAGAVAGLGVTRTFATRQSGGVDPLFGPGWASSASVPAADTYRNLTVTGSLVQVGVPDGDSISFTKKATTSTGATFAAQIGDTTLTLEYLTTGDSYRLTDAAGNVTTFTRRSTDPAQLYTPSSAVAVGSGETTATSWETATVNSVPVTRPTRVIAPAPAGVNCVTAPLTTRGCQVLTYTYATATTATTSTHGDYLGRLKQLSSTAYDPDSAAMATVALARYSYDNTGRLRAAWDPRLDYTDASGARQQATAYTYDADGILSTITPPAEQPWQLSYTTVPGDAGKGRLSKVTRSALTAGTAVTSVVYRVPVTGPAAPADLSIAQTSRWGQNTAPVGATAVFPPTQVPTGDQATGVLPTDWRQATVNYFDGNARELNTRTPGQHITAVWYDDVTGNAVRTLSATNRQRALDSSGSDSAASEATLAATLSEITRYSADGMHVVETLGPEHDVVLSDWNTVRGRQHTVLRYDENAEDPAEQYGLVTSEVTSVQYWNWAGVTVDADHRTTANEFDWKLRRQTARVVDPNGLALRTSTEYDAVGRITSVTPPAGDATHPATRTTVYYRAGTGSGYTECDSKPEWVDLPCRTAPAGQPGTDPELPATFTTYTMYGQPATVTEKNSTGTVRTTTTTYDAAGREVTNTVTAPAALGTPVQVRRNVYDAAISKPIRTEQLDSAGAVTDKIVRGYDTLGRLTSYTDATGITSTRTYDVASRLQTVNDGAADQTYRYDDAAAGHGLLNQISDGQSGSTTGNYDPDGRLLSEQRPDGTTVNRFYNEIGAQTGIEYLRAGTVVYADWAGFQAQGQRRWYSDTLTSGGYEYDAAGRLMAASQTVGASGCTMRNYQFDKSSNRTSMASYAPGGDGDCQSTDAATQRSWSYDSADRTSNPGYTYDDLGRTLTLPDDDTATGDGSGDATLTYYANDMARTITQGTSSTTHTLDVMTERFRSSSETVGAATTTSVNHYGDDSDNPNWIGEGNGYIRAITGLSGLAAQYSSTTGTLQWQIVNLHGDVVATSRSDTAGLTSTHVYDEYGNTAVANAPRYGYLGSAQRAADNTSNLITMGVRLYNPLTGRFLQTDPVWGGNPNAYVYPPDPINTTDITGKIAPLAAAAAIVGAVLTAIRAIWVACRIAKKWCIKALKYSARAIKPVALRLWYWSMAQFSRLKDYDRFDAALNCAKAVADMCHNILKNWADAKYGAGTAKVVGWGLGFTFGFVWGKKCTRKTAYQTSLW